jgi:hypothetical protein
MMRRRIGGLAQGVRRTVVGEVKLDLESDWIGRNGGKDAESH